MHSIIIIFFLTFVTLKHSEEPQFLWNSYNCDSSAHFIIKQVQTHIFVSNFLQNRAISITNLMFFLGEQSAIIQQQES